MTLYTRPAVQLSQDVIFDLRIEVRSLGDDGPDELARVWIGERELTLAEMRALPDWLLGLTSAGIDPAGWEWGAPV